MGHKYHIINLWMELNDTLAYDLGTELHRLIMSTLVGGTESGLREKRSYCTWVGYILIQLSPCIGYRSKALICSTPY